MENKHKTFYDGAYLTSDGKKHSHRTTRDFSSGRAQGGQGNSGRGGSGGGAGVASVAIKQKSSFLRKLGAFFGGLMKFLQFLASIAGLLLLVYAGFQVKTFIAKMQTVMELQGIISNLKASAPVVQFQLVEAEMEKGNVFSGATVKPDGLKTFRIGYFNASSELEEYESDLVTIKGKSIYVDCDVFNFTYSLIEKGEAQNIAIPYRIYSDEVAPEDGILLNAYNKNQIPYALLQTSELGNEEFYRLESQRLKKLMEIINDPEQAESLGIIRARQKAAVANYDTIKVGTNYVVHVENNGGITLRSK